MNLALITFERGDDRRARGLVRETLRLCQEIADASATTVRCVEIASEILQAGGASETVARLEAAANAQREALGAPLPPNERGERERTRQAAAAQLTSARYGQAWETGAQLSIQEAVDLAAGELAT